MNTILHLPINKELRTKAEFTAKKKGYSSLQEVLRVFIVQFSNEEIKPAFVNSDSVVRLTSSQEKYLASRIKDLDNAVINGDAYSVRDVEEMMEILEK
jgi:hypothetical protein